MHGLTAALGSDKKHGLPDDAVEASRGRYGANTYTQVPPKSFFSILFEGFKDPVILLLCAAATVSVLLWWWRRVGGLVTARHSTARRSGESKKVASKAVNSSTASDNHAAAVVLPSPSRHNSQLSTVIGAAIPEERHEKKWIEGIAIWAAIFLVTFVGE